MFVKLVSKTDILDTQFDAGSVSFICFVVNVNSFSGDESNFVNDSLTVWFFDRNELS